MNAEAWWAQHPETAERLRPLWDDANKGALSLDDLDTLTQNDLVTLRYVMDPWVNPSCSSIFAMKLGREYIENFETIDVPVRLYRNELNGTAWLIGAAPVFLAKQNYGYSWRIIR